MQMRSPRAFSSSRSQSALAIVLEPVADDGSIASVAQDALGGWQIGEEHQGPAGVAHLAWRQEEGQRPPSSIADHVQLGVQPALGSADALIRPPLLSGLATVRCDFRWCYR